ncbi:tRNA pseudouridine(38-40) synthase TruA [Candidatus Electrothrix sp.]|uniref:tRNA pseudouridine(38-40) synthase TruA n=2 Tax=Candidatus Electrothrix sp. TaxID=2170559 RepID=UPI0040559E1B
MQQRNIRLLIAYDGTNFCGWQRQCNGPTIQEALEKKLGIITQESVQINGAGRTDAGVHALGMVANFITTAPMPASAFGKALNSMLPKDIRILDAVDVSPDFHARFSAQGKSYRYDIFTGPLQLPAERLYRTHFPCSFQPERLQASLNLLIGTHDFSSFEAVGSRDRSRTTGRGAVRTLFHTQCLVDPARPEHFSFCFSGDGFLRHMVRNLVGTLLWVGIGRLSTDQFAAILGARDRKKAAPTAPACGLFLEKVYYDERTEEVRDS